MLVNLVGDNEGIVFFNELRDIFQFFVSENLAARIRGIAEYQGFRALSESGFKFIRVEFKFGRMKGNIYGLRARRSS